MKTRTIIALAGVTGAILIGYVWEIHAVKSPTSSAGTVIADCPPILEFAPAEKVIAAATPIYAALLGPQHAAPTYTTLRHWLTPPVRAPTIT